jgi:RimJ/RimL family protein N-acetyltransferase
MMREGGISVRRIRVGEGELFRNLRLASLRDSPSAFSTSYESAVERSPESWREQADGTAEGSDRATFLAFFGESPIGLAALYRDKLEPGTGEILQLWMAPEHRGTGASIELMDALFDWADENGLGKIIATVTKNNARALGFFLKYALEPSEEIPPEISPEGSDHVVLVKESRRNRPGFV